MMETIKVNMTPCEDIKTIHASQNDNEAREWGFELHNNGDVIDSSEISDQMVFKAYEGGTEEILPTNGSTPTTSPFKGDIKYPQGLLTDQEFLYRESPTEEDGLAKITDIKGNTIVWNQLVQNGNFESTSNWRAYIATISASNNVLTYTSTSDDGFNSLTQGKTITQNHKYLVSFDLDANGVTTNVHVRSPFNSTYTVATGRKVYSMIGTGVENNIVIQFNPLPNGSVVYIRNVMCFDLTQMGLDISSPSGFTSLFSLPYYAYNQGTLLSFNGNGIKTVGKNLFDLSQFANGTIKFENGVLNGTGAQFHTAYGTYATAKKLNCPKGSQITISFDAWTDQNATSTGNGLIIGTYHYDGTHEDAMVPNATGTPRHFTLQRQDIEKIGWSFGTQGANRWHVENFQVEFGATETSYEPYTSSTLSLPISTYFPTGMKSAGSVYDELTETKAITRVGSRAYQSGDEDDTSVITDGTTTYYALATPIETEFTTASLVTENAEIPLSNEDGVLIGKCTEELSENPGFFDAKIKLSDSDGECYSNKIQLHVERKPS